MFVLWLDVSTKLHKFRLHERLSELSEWDKQSATAEEKKNSITLEHEPISNANNYSFAVHAHC